MSMTQTEAQASLMLQVIEKLDAAYCRDQIGRDDVETARGIMEEAEEWQADTVRKACKILLYDSIVHLYRAGQQLQPTASSIAESRRKLSEILQDLSGVTDRLLIEDLTETEEGLASMGDAATTCNAYRELLAVSITQLLEICGQIQPAQESIAESRHRAGDILTALSCMTGQIVVEEAA